VTVTKRVCLNYLMLRYQENPTEIRQRRFSH